MTSRNRKKDKQEASVGKIEKIQDCAYVVLGIDSNEHDQVISVFRDFSEAKRFLVESLCTTGFYDVWVEKHAII